MYYFIVNPRSRTGQGGKIWMEIQEKLMENHLPHKAFLTEYPGHARYLADKLTKNAKESIQLAVLGGDGTLNEVLDGIADFRHTSLFYIPTGSGNDFARGMGISSNPSQALRSLLESCVPVSVDVGAIQSGKSIHRFAVSAGIGFDAAICHEALTSPVKKVLNRLRLGKLTYVFIAMKQLILCTPADMQIKLDSGAPQNYPCTYFAAVMNQRYEGGGIRFCPDARPDDGYLDVCLVSGMKKRKFLIFLLLAVLGKHTKYKGVHIFRCKSISIKSSISLPVHRDGESGGYQNEISVKLLKEPLNVFLPMI